MSLHNKLIIILCLFVMAVAGNVAMSQNYSANQVKAVFLYKITKFIRWQNENKKVKICFMGEKEDQSGNVISSVVEGLVKKESEKFVVNANITMKYVKNCDMLFIGEKSEPILQDTLALIANKPIVTISDINSFAKRGGMFGLSDEGDNVKVQLNFDKAKDSNIDINSALAEMIEVVK